MLQHPFAHVGDCEAFYDIHRPYNGTSKVTFWFTVSPRNRQGATLKVAGTVRFELTSRSFGDCCFAVKLRPYNRRRNQPAMNEQSRKERKEVSDRRAGQSRLRQPLYNISMSMSMIYFKIRLLLTNVEWLDSKPVLPPSTTFTTKLPPTKNL